VRALFFGTPAIAVPALSALAEIADIRAVICQPDRPSGRGLALTPPAVKVRALELGLHVEQPLKVRTPEFADLIRSFQTDVALVIAYGRILPPAILEAPKHGCINLHASLLPKYRGAAPITWAIVRGESETGISVMQMDEGMDTGPVFTTTAIPIGPETTADELGTALGLLAAELVGRDLPRIVRGELTAIPQDSAAMTLAPILEKENGRIHFDAPARVVHDHVRGMTPWPGAFTTAAGKTLKLLETRHFQASEGSPTAAPGTVVRATKQGIDVACAEGSVLRILRAQLEGRKPLGAAELVGGRAIQEGQLLGP
jgi:methionyl-tRNA formyltransferase